MSQHRLNLADLKAQSPKDLLSLAEELEIENASTMRKGDMMFAILKERADEEWLIGGDGVLEVVQDGFGFLRSPEANYLPGPDDIYVSPDMIRKHSLRTGDTVEGVMKEPNDTERYFALVTVEAINFEAPEKAKHKVAFDNLTPLYPEERLKMEVDVEHDKQADVIDGAAEHVEQADRAVGLRAVVMLGEVVPISVCEVLPDAAVLDEVCHGPQLRNLIRGHGLNHAPDCAVTC